MRFRLRDVAIAVDINGVAVADCVVFENCTFSKEGGWFLTDGFSSKGRFTNCLLYRSNFASLTRIDYGVKFENCTFVETALQERAMPPGDLRKEYGGEWNTVRACHFVRCSATPSFVWMTADCGFFACSVRGEGTFQSSTDLPVRLHAVFPIRSCATWRGRPSLRGRGRWATPARGRRSRAAVPRACGRSSPSIRRPRRSDGGVTAKRQTVPTACRKRPAAYDVRHVTRR